MFSRPATAGTPSPFGAGAGFGAPKPSVFGSGSGGAVFGQVQCSAVYSLYGCDVFTLVGGWQEMHEKTKCVKRKRRVCLGDLSSGHD